MNKNVNTIVNLRDFPSVEILTGHEALHSYIDSLSRPVVAKSVKDFISLLKEKFRSESISISQDDILKYIIKDLDRKMHQKLIRVINGTGIIIHTNLGRAPVSKDMLESAFDSVTGYSNLEFDLDTGKRGKRGLLVEHLLALLSSTESGTIVNNNAAALFIILNTVALRKEVIISRGELVQIGGGFKIPEIMTRSGVKLIEVGTTNRTSLDDYAAAVTDRTAMILKVHRSNFSQVGFVEETPLNKLAELCRKRNLILVNDLGSGLYGFPPGIEINDEPDVPQSVRAGADLTCFSGDKLLGGPQAGLIVGRKDLVGRIKRNPLFRTLRCDKLVFHLMVQVLITYLNGEQFNKIPIWKMISVPVGGLKLRGEEIIRKCPGKDIVLAGCKAYLGGGSTPSQAIPSLALSIRSTVKPNTLAIKFRRRETPIIGRVEDNNFMIDLRAVAPQDDSLIIEAIQNLV